MTTVINYKTVTFSKHLEGISDWSEYINLSFKPNEMVLKYINKYDNDLNNDVPRGDYMNLLYCDLCQGPLFSIPLTQSYSSNLDVPFRLENQLQSSFNFRLRDLSGGFPSNLNTIDMYLSFTITFIQKNYLL